MSTLRILSNKFNNWSVVILLILLTSCGENKKFVHHQNRQSINDTLKSIGIKRVEVDTVGSLIEYTEFSDDSLHAEYSLLNMDGKVIVEGKLEDGRKVGIWKYYDRKGILVFELSRIHDNDSMHVQRHNVVYKPSKIGYLKVFQGENSYLQAQGLIGYETAPDDDTSVELGPWLYYNETGLQIDSLYFDFFKR